MARYKTVGIIVAALLVVAIGAGVFLFTRGDDDGDGGTTGASVATPSASGLISAAAKQWDATNSAHFNLNVDGKTYLDSANTLELVSADGDILRPDSVNTSIKVNVAIATFDVKIIAIGDDMYMTSFVTGEWGPAPPDLGYNPAVLFSPTEGLSAVLPTLQNPTLGGTETVQGRETQIVTGTTTGDAIEAMTGGGLKGDSIATTIWIAKDNSDIVEIVLSAPSSNGGQPTKWTLVVTKQNEPLTITPPT
jgi:LppX_LprAFG lipoprotein